MTGLSDAPGSRESKRALEGLRSKGEGLVKREATTYHKIHPAMEGDMFVRKMIPQRIILTEQKPASRRGSITETRMEAGILNRITAR